VRRTKAMYDAQNVTYATQSSGKPMKSPTQKKRFPASRLCLTAGMRPTTIMGI
jgi:hypothetical protein